MAVNNDVATHHPSTQDNPDMGASSRVPTPRLRRA